MRRFRLFALICLSLFHVVLCANDSAEEVSEVPAGKGLFTVDIPTSNGTSSLSVFYYKPPSASPETQVVFVLHGLKRNAKTYRDHWITVADQHNLIILAPEFTDELFPRSKGYNLGNVLSPNGEENPRETWSFAMIEKVFDQFREKLNTKCTRFNIFGHSAGAQFVHRMIELYPQDNIGTAIAANAGWYTLPVETEAWPYGLRNGPQIDWTTTAPNVFAQDFVVLLGENDNDPSHKYLRKTPEARAQGAHRFARGQYFFQLAEQEAKRLDTPFNWRLQVVPGIGHSAAKMAGSAAKILAESPSCQ